MSDNTRDLATYCRAIDCGRPTDAFLCPNCGDDVEATLHEIPGLMYEVSVLATGQARVYRRNGKPVPLEELAEWDAEQASIPAWLRTPFPRMALPATRAIVNPAARDMLDEAWTMLATWARHLVESRGAESAWPHTLTPTTLADWLAERTNSIRYDEAAAEILYDFVRLRRRMVHLVDRAPSRVYAGPCNAELKDGGKCKARLYAYPSTDRNAEITCDGYRPPTVREDDAEPSAPCKATHTRAERTQWLMDELTDALYPLDFWQRWLPTLIDDLTWPNRSTWWRWRENSRLEVKSINRDGEELYRGGDVVDLVEREQPRIVGNRSKATRRDCA